MGLNANALITIDDFRNYMGDGVSSAFENLMELIINGVSQEFDRFVSRILKQATHTNLYLDGNGERILNLPNWPAADLGTVTEDETLLVNGLTGDYVLYTSDDDAYLYKIGGVWLEGPKTVLISTIKLGYATVPGDIQLKCIKQCALEYQQMKKKELGESSHSRGDESVSFVELGLLPDVEAVLKRYRRFKL